MLPPMPIITPPAVQLSLDVGTGSSLMFCAAVTCVADTDEPSESTAVMTYTWAELGDVPTSAKLALPGTVIVVFSGSTTMM